MTAKEKAEHTLEAVAWIAQHGSSRLRKIVEAGLLDCSWSVYFDERLAQEWPDWQWLPAGKGTGADPLNPSEDAVQALLEARARVHDVQSAHLRSFVVAKIPCERARTPARASLSSVEGTHDLACGDCKLKWGLAVVIDGLPWAPGRLLYRWVDVP